MGRARRTLVIVAFTLVSCSNQVVPASTPTTDAITLRLYTSSATIPLTNDLTRSYTQIQPSISFDIITGNYERVVDLITEENPAYFLTNHLPIESALWGAPIGQDGIAIITHPDNPVINLTTEQLRRIYQGRIVNWREVGGLDVPITVISREQGSGTRAEFERLVMGERRTIQSAEIAPSSEAVVVSAGREPGGIGYVSMSYLDASVRAIHVDDIAPTLENVYLNTYPLRATLFIAGLNEPQNEYRAFIAWAQSLDGQAVVARKYAPLSKP
jgi:phosphate transport system substrate-binding protein